MDRRGARAGVSLLLVATLLVIVPVALRPRQLDGAGVAAPMPEPPQVGDCLAMDRRIVVPCEQPHYSEVTERWTADDPARVTQNLFERCEVAATEYMDFEQSPLPDWYIFVRSRAERVDAPPGARIGTRGWTVCTVTVGLGELVTGSLRAITAADRPPMTASCVRGVDSTVVSCGGPHDREELAMTWQTVPDPTGAAVPLSPDGSFGDQTAVVLPPEVAADIDAQCARLAAVVLDSADPTRGGELAVQVQPQLFGAAPHEPGMAIVSAGCSIGPTDGRRLVGSLIGLGDAAPTFE